MTETHQCLFSKAAAPVLSLGVPLSVGPGGGSCGINQLITDQKIPIPHRGLGRVWPPTPTHSGHVSNRHSLTFSSLCYIVYRHFI